MYAMKSSYKAASRILVTSMRQQQKATERSLRDLETNIIQYYSMWPDRPQYIDL